MDSFSYFESQVGTQQSVFKNVISTPFVEILLKKYNFSVNFLLWFKPDKLFFFYLSQLSDTKQTIIPRSIEILYLFNMFISLLLTILYSVLFYSILLYSYLSFSILLYSCYSQAAKMLEVNKSSLGRQKSLNAVKPGCLVRLHNIYGSQHNIFVFIWINYNRQFVY